MKRLMAIAIAVAVALVIAAFAMVGPVSADPPENPVVFETSLVPNLVNYIPNYYNSVDLDEGEVKVYADGSWKVEIKGLELDEALFTGDLEVILWDIEYRNGNWQRKASPNQYAANPETITLEDGEGTLEVAEGSIYSGKHPGFVVQVTDPGVAWLLTSGFNISY